MGGIRGVGKDARQDLRIFLIVLAFLFGCDNKATVGNITTGQPIAFTGDIGKNIQTTWYWNNDSQVFYQNGRGVYYRNGNICFNFSYSLNGNVLTETADQAHSCGGAIVSSYQIAIAPMSLTMTHVGSGTVSNWSRISANGNKSATVVIPGSTATTPATPPKVAADFDTTVPPSPPPLHAGVRTRSIQLRTIANRLPVGAVIGASESGSECQPRNGILSTAIPVAANTTLFRTFFSRLKDDGYDVLNDPNNLFQDKITLKPDVMVGVAVVAAKENLCFPQGAINPATMVHSAELSLDLEWQVFDVLANHMVATITTHGYAQIKEPAVGANSTVLADAFNANLNKLLADSSFHALVTSPAPANSANAVPQNPFAALLQANGSVAGAKAATDFDHSLPPPPPPPLKLGVKTRPFQLTRIINRLQLGTSIGAVEVGSDCAPRSTLPPTFQMASANSAWYRTFYKRLKEAGYEVLGNPDDIFEDKSQLRPDFFIGAIIVGEKRNVCFPDGVTNLQQSPHKVEQSLDIEWQVYDTLSKTVAATVKTHGYIAEEAAEVGASDKAYDEIFTQAINGLLADKSFQAAVAAGSELSDDALEEGESERLVKMKLLSPLSGSISSNVRAVQTAVVTILVPGGHGSGVLLGREGIVPTDRHVVGTAKAVKVKTFDGREFPGRVVVADQRHDAAMIKVQGSLGEIGLPIAVAPVPVGADVYAVGSPLSTSLANTMTKGIVSGYRVFDGVTHIQSDVSVQPGESGGPLLDDSGNVIGLTRASVLRGTSNTGVNFFMPIGAALQSLGVVIDDSPR